MTFEESTLTCHQLGGLMPLPGNSEEIEDLIINHYVPSENIVVAGASQGGVLTIWCALYCKRKLGGFLPIVTWLPLRNINDITQISPPLLTGADEDK